MVPLGIEEQEGEVMLAGDADVRFVSGSGRAQKRFAAEIEVVTVVGGGLGVVEDGLIAERHGRRLVEDLCGFAGGESEGDVEG